MGVVRYGLVAGCVIVAVTAPGCIWGGCTDEAFTYAVNDAQIALLTEGTSSPTQNGCAVVCIDERNGTWNPVPWEDAALDWNLPDSSPLGTDAGIHAASFIDAASLIWPRPESCTLSRHDLTCVWHACAN